MSDFDKFGIKRLDVDNYATWSTKMRFLLITKGYWTAVEEEGQDNDAKALALIGLCVEDHHLSTIDKCSTAKEAWETLASIYKAKSIAKVLQLKRELNSLKKETSEPITKYIARAKNIRDQLHAAGHKVDDEDVVLSALAGLPTEYNTLVSILENGDSAPTLDEV